MNGWNEWELWGSSGWSYRGGVPGQKPLLSCGDRSKQAKPKQPTQLFSRPKEFMFFQVGRIKKSIIKEPKMVIPACPNATTKAPSESVQAMGHWLCVRAWAVMYCPAASTCVCVFTLELNDGVPFSLDQMSETSFYVPLSPVSLSRRQLALYWKASELLPWVCYSCIYQRGQKELASSDHAGFRLYSERDGSAYWTILHIQMEWFAQKRL